MIGALKEYKLENTVANLIQTIIFDSIIGNGDRHQENWGYIQSVKEKDLRKIKVATQLFGNKIFRNIVKTVIFIRFIRTFVTAKLKLNLLDKLLDTFKGEYSPIYDSGSCLGRELEDEKVDRMLGDEKMLLAYVNKGTAEIRWDGPKLKHFELISHIKCEYPEIVKEVILKINDEYNEEKIRNIVFNIIVVR